MKPPAPRRRRLLARLTCAAVLALGSCQGAGRYLADRARDVADCVKLNVGAGLGLTLDVRVTDWIAPGIGVRAHAWCVGWEDREIYGAWNEVLVIHTPRAAWELSYSEAEGPEDPGMTAETRALRLFMSSMLLANERWIRHPGGHPVTVEYASLFNLGQSGEKLRASSPGHFLLEEGEVARTRQESAWRKGFVEVGVMVGPVQARAGVNPLEVLDLACGLLGFDPAGDDH